MHLKLRSTSASPIAVTEELIRRENLKKRHGLMIKNNFSILSSQRNKKFLAGAHSSKPKNCSFLSPQQAPAPETFRHQNDTRNFKSIVSHSNLLVVNSEHHKTLQEHLGPKTDRNVVGTAGTGSKRGKIVD